MKQVNTQDINFDRIDLTNSAHEAEFYTELIKLFDFIKENSEKRQFVVNKLKENSVALLKDIVTIKDPKTYEILNSNIGITLSYLPSRVIARREGWNIPVLEGNYSAEEAEQHLQILGQIAKTKNIAAITFEELEEERLCSKIQAQNSIIKAKKSQNKDHNTIESELNKISDTEIKIQYYQRALETYDYEEITKQEAVYSEERKSLICAQAEKIYNATIAKNNDNYALYVKAIDHLKKLIQRDIELKNHSIVIPNQVMKAMTGKQKGLLQDVRKNADTIKALLKSLIKNNTSITYEQKKEQVDQIDCGDISFQMDCYLGANFTLYEIVFIRAIEVIVSKMISAGEIGNHFGLIYIPWHKIYEECAVAPRPEGGYEWKASKRIRDVLKEGGNLRKTILVKNEFEQQIMDTSFILETQLRTMKVIKHQVDSETKIKSEIEETQNIGVGLRLSSFLFFSPDYDEKLKMCTLMDNKGFIRFRKINKTQLGFSLFIWLERYISLHDKTKTLDMNTIIVNLNLVKEYKNKPKRTKEDIERAFNDMIEQKTLITAFKKEIGAKGQEQYIFTNARYKPAPPKANLKKSTESFH